MTLLDPTTAVWNLSKSTGTERVVMLALAHHADPDGYCWPGLERIADMANVGERAAQAALAKRVEAGELAVLRGRGRGHASLYRVVLGQPEGAGDPEVMLAWLRTKTSPFLADLYKKVQSASPFVAPRKGAAHDTVTPRNSEAHGREKVQSAAPKLARIRNEPPVEEPDLPPPSADATDPVVEILDAEIIDDGEPPPDANPEPENKPENAGTVYGAYLDWRRAQGIADPDDRTRGQITKALGGAFAAGHPPEVVKRGLWVWHHSPHGPSSLSGYIDSEARGGGRTSPLSEHERRLAASVQELLDLEAS